MEDKKTVIEKLNEEQAIENGHEPSMPIMDKNYHRGGLTKRETMAMHLCSALVVNKPQDFAVTHSVIMADMLLNELRKTRK